MRRFFSVNEEVMLYEIKFFLQLSDKRYLVQNGWCKSWLKGCKMFITPVYQISFKKYDSVPHQGTMRSVPPLNNSCVDLIKNFIHKLEFIYFILHQTHINSV